ncbi:MAG: GNAT family N-acetyltransferase [Thermorudis peleae]|nr:GNAT family N-acetyltransferase [Thermorudis peleae]
MARRYTITPLLPSDAHRVRLSWSSRYTPQALAQHLSAYPGLSCWIPESGEYVIAGPWRHRSEIIGILELSANQHAPVLLDYVSEAAHEHGARLLVMQEQHERRSPIFYANVGFTLIEQILVYELTVFHPPMPDGRLRFERVSPDDPFVFGELLSVDHTAFSWLWRNSEAEFTDYLADPQVDVYLGRNAQGEAVSYVGVTRMRGWGHLDRLAVGRDYQGQGYGLASLTWAVWLLAQRGAHRVALSTQARNRRSRALYERFGFHRTPSFDYDIYGRWLGEPVPLDDEVEIHDHRLKG